MSNPHLLSFKMSPALLSFSSTVVILTSYSASDFPVTMTSSTNSCVDGIPCIRSFTARWKIAGTNVTPKFNFCILKSPDVYSTPKAPGFPCPTHTSKHVTGPA